MKYIFSKNNVFSICLKILPFNVLISVRDGLGYINTPFIMIVIFKIIHEHFCFRLI